MVMILLGDCLLRAVGGLTGPSAPLRRLLASIFMLERPYLDRGVSSTSESRKDSTFWRFSSTDSMIGSCNNTAKGEKKIENKIYLVHFFN